MLEALQSVYTYVFGQLFAAPEQEPAPALPNADSPKRKASDPDSDSPKRLRTDHASTSSASVESPAKTDLKPASPRRTPRRTERAATPTRTRTTPTKRSSPAAKRATPAKKSPARKKAQTVFQVDRILNHRLTPEGSVEYLIRWQGFGPSDDSWEPAANVLSQVLIAEYENRSS
eukprot:TRINITY_DN19703_c0_g1_i1.p1 TRINITY_DN19703_c0_g1~~TRINITY_DN19703_c0_g1_i1.p1  ORF type:complete len:174 (-),score=35.63 TRINITY_DN19703_c0_g1_i1:65-586(-)